MINLIRRCCFALTLGLAVLQAQGQAPVWSGTWGAAPAGPPPAARLLSLTDQTLRLIVHTSNGGSRVRIRLSNEMGSTPLRIGSAHIGLRASGAVVAADTDRVLTFGGARSIIIPAGARAVSDGVVLNVPALADLTVSLFLPGASGATTIHESAFQTGYVSTPGDFTGSPALPIKATIGAWPFLAGVDLDLAAPVVVAFGDSITDGLKSTPNANRRWPDLLAQRLHSVGAGVVNRGISANQLLTTEPSGLLAGRAGLERYERDVLSTPGVRAVIVLIGINDISYHSASAASLIDGYRQLVARGRARGIRVWGATLLPFESSPYYTAARDTIRRSVNSWIRSGDGFDGIIDFDAALRDPARPARLLPAWDSGDHLHPNDAGYQRMANLVPLGLFSATSTQPEPAQSAAPGE
ncbi:SGNH/GDSL hydrolase family protein [Massilia sp. S19_KUP03_FR1]|uniref:SGNH/GDSL hydrolase family protein n=1 Tax=Massilia sp. S19_KUP03_FR1 TaxID=3025503 RepID=UPI002FCD8507